MLFDSSLRKELGRSFGATAVVLVTIVMTVMLIRTLGHASRGLVNPAEVMQVMGFTVLGHLPTILPLSLFVAITATLTRMYANSEMVVWFSCGKGLLSFARPVLRFAWPVLLAVAVLSLVVWPWSNLQIRELRERYQGRGDIERVAPGRFIESQGGLRVFFIDRNSPDDLTGNNIFIAATERGRESVTSAERGHIEDIDGERFLVLHQGQQLARELEGGEMRLSHFARHGNRLSETAAEHTAISNPAQLSTPTLLANPTPRHLGELSRRIGLVLAAFNCTLIALAATRVNPRAGRGSSLVFSLAAFTVYYNLLAAGENWIARGRIGIWSFVVLLHGSIFIAAMLWLLARNGEWLMRWRLRRAAAAQKHEEPQP
ncbi:MAG: LPS export ABC transporter permease LptF [Ottowia sp.]|nr:LPS export ABC transporter permease LptF [Ottowia sp.]